MRNLGIAVLGMLKGCDRFWDLGVRSLLWMWGAISVWGFGRCDRWLWMWECDRF
ncbi:hypothetical protein [Dolichospermum flos-aquae]|uniref:Uncharacterized protein n=1 Tax=Dolichospermum flos-aquae LEGE 04289 TaxID=1828708 RepID=A0ACC5Q254_DOLFA|nr:hypothetical protein [Dolichospermum flos-aquae]MBE9218638.1 hypothetical protein [Dolichospermum flos-aquae LEGE 04289]